MKKMEIIRPQSKNVLTLTWVAAISLMGAIIVVVLNETGRSLSMGPGAVEPYLGALFPMLFAGLPLLLLTGFIYGVYSIPREETKVGRIQVISLLIILLALGYIVSLSMFTGGID